MSVNDDQVKGKVKQAEGAVRDAKGDLTDDPSDDLAGKAKKVEGKAQETFGDVKKRYTTRQSSSCIGVFQGPPAEQAALLILCF